MAERFDEAAADYAVAADVWEELGVHDRARFARRQALGLARHGAEWAPVRVMFRVERSGPFAGEVFAILPDLAGSYYAGHVTLLNRHGHTTGPLHANIWSSRPARPEEYEALERVMVLAYGYDVRVVYRATNHPGAKLPRRVPREWSSR